jgi:hypothetical protein
MPYVDFGGTWAEYEEYLEEETDLRNDKRRYDIQLLLFIHGCFVGYMLLYEIVLCTYISVKMEFKCAQNSCYLLGKLLTGTMRRAQILLQALLAAEFCATENVATNVFALTLALLLVLSQVKSF